MSFTSLVKLWILADVLQIPMLQNEIVGLILKKMSAERRCMDREAIDYVYQNTIEDSKLRSLTYKSVEMAMRCGFAGHELESRRDLNQPHNLAWANDVLEMYAMRDRSRLDKVFWGWTDLEAQCQWHIHPDGTKCSAATNA